jgi:hypothetical protein
MVAEAARIKANLIHQPDCTLAMVNRREQRRRQKVARERL